MNLTHLTRLEFYVIILGFLKSTKSYFLVLSFIRLVYELFILYLLWKIRKYEMNLVQTILIDLTQN